MGSSIQTMKRLTLNRDLAGTSSEKLSWLAQSPKPWKKDNTQSNLLALTSRSATKTWLLLKTQSWEIVTNTNYWNSKRELSKSNLMSSSLTSKTNTTQANGQSAIWGLIGFQILKKKSVTRQGKRVLILNSMHWRKWITLPLKEEMISIQKWRTICRRTNSVSRTFSAKRTPFSLTTIQTSTNYQCRWLKKTAELNLTRKS